MSSSYLEGSTCKRQTTVNKINVHVALFELHIVYTVRDLVVIKDKENAFAH